MNNKFIPIELYKEVMDIAPVVTIDVLFFNKDKDKTMLFRRTNEPLKGNYFSIGGRLAKGETFIEGALRHTKKELGFILDPAKLLRGGVQEEIHPNSIFPDVSYHSVNVFYGYILEDDVLPLLDSQHDEYQWFSVTEEALHPMMKTKIEETLRKL